MSTSSGKRFRQLMDFLRRFSGDCDEDIRDMLRIEYREYLMQSKDLPADVIGDDLIDHMLEIDETWEIPQRGRNGWIEFEGVKWPVDFEGPMISCDSEEIDFTQHERFDQPPPCCCDVSLESCCGIDFENLSIEVQ